MANPVILVCGWDNNDDFFLVWSDGASQQELLDLADLAKEGLIDGYSSPEAGPGEVQQ